MDNHSQTLYKAARDSDNIFLVPSQEKKIMCCFISEKWCFEHSGIAGLNQYDESKNNFCKCLDCCTWCLEFNLKKPCISIKDTNCYFCCLTIYFT
jgi:hypothetical protein